MNTDIVSRSTLFAGIADADIEKLCRCLRSRTQRYKKGDFIWRTDDFVLSAGLILQGFVRAERVTVEGERRIAAIHGVGGLIGDVLMAEGRKSPVDVIAETDCELLFIPFEGIMTGCPQACPCHARLRLNLLQEIARKYWRQQARIQCLEAPKLRQKLLLYLRGCAEAAGGGIFRVPLNREALAAYLAVDRSALCRELSLMKKDGLIDYYRESFRLLDAEKDKKSLGKL